LHSIWYSFPVFCLHFASFIASISTVFCSSSVTPPSDY
jgi:hypothetical protein